MHETVEVDECELGFEMRIFAQMAASVAWVGQNEDERP
jgi:hypothetical protein